VNEVVGNKITIRRPKDYMLPSRIQTWVIYLHIFKAYT